ncbi:hypothetical protein O0L34_g10920 [Tuta absoluta]|nr:hypothetical protein O0L34_g10920 [Tuta absoluta]
MPKFNGQENDKALYDTSRNVIVTLDDVEFPEAKEIPEDIEEEHGDSFLPIHDYIRLERNETVANNSIEDNLNEEDIKTRSNSATVAEEENLLGSNETISGNKMQGNILGGAYADIKDYPHSAFIMSFCNAKNAEDYWMCGGSVLTQKHLLTAAHCLYGCKGNFKIDVLAGSSNYEKAKVLRQAKRLVYHKQYRDEGVYADIGMVLLYENLPLNKEIKRVVIRPYFPRMLEGQMAGWGVIDEKGTMTTKLKVVKQNVWQLSTCLKYETLEPGTFCASSGSNKHYALSGDSGSALVVHNYQQLGLVSYREEDHPMLIVYTNVSYYYNWIKEWAHKLNCMK